MRAAALIELNDIRREQIERGRQRLAKANAEAAKAAAHTAPLNDRTGAAPPSEAVLLQCAADVKPQPVTWLWPDWLPAGKLTILAGASGTGKTTLAHALAAVVTRGGTWPDGTACAHPGEVLMWSSEDDPADTLVPRLMAAGADLPKVHFVRNVAKTGGELVPFDPARDMPILSERISSMGGARLLIVDPVLSAIGGDAHRANDVRRDLQPLVDLAARHGCAVIGISHFSKGSKGNAPVERVIGSQAFGALARMVLVTAKDETAERRILARAKSNIAPDDGGFGYVLNRVEVQAGIVANAVTWGEAIEGNARDILGEVEQDGDERRTLRDEAREFLAGLLADGPMNASRIRRDADGAGYSWSTMHRAAHELNVERVKQGMKDGWRWALPKISDGEDFTKIPEHASVKSSEGREIFGSGAGLRSAPLGGFAEDFSGRELESSEKSSTQAGPGDDDSNVKDSV
ncbi:ATP-binding protein [Paraburkholderia tuberum]|uniref:AAA family ATPase n=1 Tax=Paraburkholderia sp. WSM4174 TaxID=2991071 RepID=UPI000DD77917